MDLQLIALCGLTFVIHLIGTLAYAVRIAGVRTRRIAVSFALFNVLVLVSRTSNSLQGPFLAKRVDATLARHIPNHLSSDFRWLLLSATVATLVGAVSVPTFQRLFSRAVLHFQAHRSIPELLLHVYAKGGLSYIRESVTAPAPQHLSDLRRQPEVSARGVGLGHRPECRRPGIGDGGGVRRPLRQLANPLSSDCNQSIVRDQRRRDDPPGRLHRSAPLDHDRRRGGGPHQRSRLQAGGRVAVGRPGRRHVVGSGPAGPGSPADRPDREAAIMGGAPLCRRLFPTDAATSP